MIYMFLVDNTFLISKEGNYGVGGACQISQKSLTYFNTAYYLNDTRTSRNVQLNSEIYTTKLHLILDSAQSSDFITTIGTWTATDFSNFFNVIDAACFLYANNLESNYIESYMSSNVGYVGNSITYSTEYSSSVTTSNGQVVALPKSVTFSFIDSFENENQFTIYLDDIFFQNTYPIFTIDIIIPQLDLTTLYNADLITTTGNIFTTSYQTAINDINSLNGSSTQPYTQSGVVGYKATFYDDANNSTSVLFTLIYKGKTPLFSSQRAAIKNYIVASGIGSLTVWETRCPELFVDETFYLIPLYNNTYKSSTSTIYQGIIPLQNITSYLIENLPGLTSTFIESNMQLLQSSYDDIYVVGIPDSANDSNYMSLVEQHPTYQSYATTDTNFALMNTYTQKFSKTLSTILSLIINNQSNGPYQMQTVNNVDFISFSVLNIEFYVMVNSSYSAGS